MDYPRLNKKELSTNLKFYFKQCYGQIKAQMLFDNSENELGLTKKDVELLAYNAAVIITSQEKNRRDLEIKRLSE